MPFDRRLLLALAGLGAGLPAAAAAAKRGAATAAPSASAGETGLVPDSDRDQTDVLQRLIDEAAHRRVTLQLPPGRFHTRTLTLRKGSRIDGGGAAILRQSGSGALLSANAADDLRIANLALDGRFAASTVRDGLITIRRAAQVVVSGVTVRDTLDSGVVLEGCSGRFCGNMIESVGEAAIFSTDATGLEISGNTIAGAGNNGILVWRTTAGEDGTIVTGNRIEKVAATGGGSGQNGNGINVYRAGDVIVSNNRITDCAFTAVRGNAASNIQITANHCRRLGEVALYAEFGFQGAVIAGNVVDGAATGISVTNFNEGGRLAVIQGNLIRNLFRRENEPVDKRGDGIAVEADAAVTGNTIENAPACGILVGWGRYMRDVNVTGNVIRVARVGIGVTGDAEAGKVMIASNLISGARDGAIRALKLAEPYGPDLATTRTDNARVLIERNLGT